MRDEDMNELISINACKSRGLVAQRLEPRGYGLCGTHPRMFEIVVPAERCREPLAQPTLEAKRRQVDGVDGRDQCALLGFVDSIIGIGQSVQRQEQFGLASQHGGHPHGEKLEQV